VLAEISAKTSPFDETQMSGLKNEELGILALTTDAGAGGRPRSGTAGTALEHDTKTWQPNRSMAVTEISVTMAWQLEEIGFAFEALNSWNFNVLELDALKLEQISAWILMNNPGSCTYTEQQVDAQKLRTFIAKVADGYFQNPYHNAIHAVDVTHTVFRYMSLMQVDLLFTMLEQFALLVASLSHDVGHIGLNNAFLTEVQHELAVRYNDRSPLENMHCCKLFEILALPGQNVFDKLQVDEYKDVRKHIIDVILHTDIAKHPPMVKEFEQLYDVNSKVFEGNNSTSLSAQEVEILSTPENKKLIMRAILHGADISNATKPWNVARAWAYRVLEEYANQGDQEKSLGIPVQVLNDRDKVNKPNSQIGFMEFIITPWVVAKVKVFPALFEASLLLETNLNNWENMWIQDSKPSEAEREKVKERVEKIVTNLRNRPLRGGAHGALTSPSKGSGGRRRSFLAT